MSTLFGRRTEVIIEGKVLKAPPLTIAFELPFSDDEKENTGSITLYNLSRQTIDLFKKDVYVILKSGYKNNFGTISTFTIKESTVRTEGVDRVLQVTVGEEDGRWKNALINKTWRANILASEIIKDIVNGLGLTLGELTLPIDLQYPRGKIFSKAAKLCLQELAKDCYATLTFSRGTIYIRPPQNGIKTGFILNKNTGLIGSPEKITNEKGEIAYNVTSLMNYQIEIGSILSIQSKTANGLFKVRKGTYISNEADHVVQMEVVPYEAI